MRKSTVYSLLQGKEVIKGMPLIHIINNMHTYVVHEVMKTASITRVSELCGFFLQRLPPFMTQRKHSTVYIFFSLSLSLQLFI